MKSFNHLESRVLEWAFDRDILTKGTIIGQFKKTKEEIEELEGALSRNDKEKIKDGIGDVIVTLIILAKLTNVGDVETCLNHAYDQIKNRKGKLIDGIFVKEIKKRDFR